MRYPFHVTRHKKDPISFANSKDPDQSAHVRGLDSDKCSQYAACSDIDVYTETGKYMH